MSMAPLVIDLTSSPEPEETPRKAAQSALSIFQPRSEKADQSERKNDKQNYSPARVAPPPLKHFEPRQSNQPHLSNERTAPPSMPEPLPSPTGPADLLLHSHGHGQGGKVVAENGYARPLQRSTSSSVQTSRASYHAHPCGEPKLRPFLFSGLDTKNKANVAKQATTLAPTVSKAPIEVISIDDDSDGISSSGHVLLTISELLQAELNGPRPLKKRRIDGPKGMLTGPIDQHADSSVEGHIAIRPINGYAGSAVRIAESPSLTGLPARPTPSPLEGKRAAISSTGPVALNSMNGRTHSESERMDIHHGKSLSAETASNWLASVRSRYEGRRPSASTLSSHLSYKSTDSGSESNSGYQQKSAEQYKDTQSRNSTTAISSSKLQSTTTVGSGKQVLPYTRAEDDLLVRLREHEKLDWNNILPRFPGRSMGSITGHYSQLKTRSREHRQKLRTSDQRPSNLGSLSNSYSQAEDDLLIKLREVDKLDWHTILPHFPGRAMGSISGHYGQVKARLSKQIAIQPISVQHHRQSSNRGSSYSAEEDALLVKLKEIQNHNWDEILPYFPGRTRGALQVRHSVLKSASGKNQNTFTKATVEPQRSNTNHGIPYSSQEDALVLKLRGAGLGWDQMVMSFNGRTAGSLAVRYSSKLKDKHPKRFALDNDAAQQVSTDEDDSSIRPRQRRRHNGPSVLSGFISWADLKKSKRKIFEDDESAAEGEEQGKGPRRDTSWHNSERAYPKPLSRILRQRETGDNGGRSWSPLTRSIPDELKEHVYDDIGPRTFFQGTSGDVTCIAWAADGRRFAAGSIAITDERSMQYNRPCNLLLGDAHKFFVQELPDHHIQRPTNTDVGNVNSLHAMRETQDQRLFMTVGGVQFSPDGNTLYSAGMDGKARAYQVDSCDFRTGCQYKLEHPAAVDLLSIGNFDTLATACHQPDDCIRVYKDGIQTSSLSPSRADSQTARPTYPSALRWGASWRHSYLLLAGFSIDSADEERNLAGETCLWDMHHGQRIELNATTYNVFDVAWNPSPSSASTAFAVASTPGVNKVNRGIKTIVQCFAPQQNRARAVFDFESPAFDINDLIYCPYDYNLIAAGATDGMVYVWDQRYAKQGNGPLHVLAHGRSLNVLDHERDRELTDTGVRFLSWGATSSRLYSGSSDGIVAGWNPYRSTTEAHVNDIATFTSAVMSGAFSPDYRELLIGEDQGRFNLLSVGHGRQSIRSMDRFELRQARSSEGAALHQYSGHAMARFMLESGQIEFKSMGAHAKRQAVQGPNYSGPYLAPSAQELQEAENEYQRALDMQRQMHSQAAVNPDQSCDEGQSLLEADKRVITAQEKSAHLQNRLDDHEALEPHASATQRTFKIAEEESTQQEASLMFALEQCKLDCTYLPTELDVEGEVPDSRRSERRIPTALWNMPVMHTTGMNVDELIDAGLTHKCATCQKPARRSKAALTLCESCTLKRLGMTAACEVCSAPMRPMTEAKRPSLCERCNFSCFRCGKPAFLNDNATEVSCYQCDLSWIASVLGYELATTDVTSTTSDGMGIPGEEEIDDEDMMR